MQMQVILDQIDLGAMALPEFQRGYVWNREQVRGLMHSLYHKHPVGSLLVWTTKTENANSRGDLPLSPGTVKLLLDGQQRITSVYGIVRGKPPRFFDGNALAFSNLYFNLDDEVFEFYSPTKMKGDPRWISVSELMRNGVGTTIQRIMSEPKLQQNVSTYISRINAIEGIKSIDMHVEEVTGEDKTVDVVVDIFNRVNRGGTKLSKGDLTLAKICAEWPDAREEMKRLLQKWRKAGFHFTLDWLLRCVNAVVTGEALFTAMRDVDSERVREGLRTTEKAIDKLLNLVAGRLGLDHDRVLASRYAFPLMARYLVQRGGSLKGQAERDKLLFWYIHTILWGRYSGSTESMLNVDLEAIEDATKQSPGKSLDRLIENLRANRGDLRLLESDFAGSSKGNRFYPLLYLMTRVCHARDWGTGDELANHLLGHLAQLQIHHIFPRALLKEHGYARKQINAIANFTFLTQETNLEVSKRDPAEYFIDYEKRNPGAIATHWIPEEPRYRKAQNYLTFLEERRRLLAAAANTFLEKLAKGTIPEPVDVDKLNVVERAAAVVPGSFEDDEEERKLNLCNSWVVKKGLPEGKLSHEILDPDSNEVLATFDLAWPDGLQEGLSDPVAVLIDEGPEVEQVANNAGFRYFTSVSSFKRYVRQEILADSKDVDSDLE